MIENGAVIITKLRLNYKKLSFKKVKKYKKYLQREYRNLKLK
jgi:hypothetical protein